MRYRNKMWKKAITVAISSVLLLQGGLVSAEEVPQQWLELTAPVLETEEGSAVSADLKIGDWLDYSDYGMEREDVVGGTYSFALTTKDADGEVIDDGQLAYCVQSYFLTPLPGDHSEDMIDQVAAIGGQKNLQKVFYYGYGGAAYDVAEFESVLKETNAEYYENTYMQLGDEEKEELAYILTHSAATYAYFNDGTDLEDYFALQFQVKYGEDWKQQYEYFKEIELNDAGIEEDDMNLYGSTYGMTTTGIELAKKWYEVLTSKENPGLSVDVSDGMFIFNGNERNEALEMQFTVPDGFVCEIFCANGENELLEEGTAASICPGDSFAFKYVDGVFAAEKDGITDLNVEVAGTLAGTENEAWNLVLLETNKGNAEKVSKRQQDIAAVSMIDAGRTELNFDITLQKENVELILTDEVQQAVSGAVLGVYYDEACTDPVTQDGKEVQLVTDETGKAYLEYIINQKLEENGNKLYAKEISAPEWNEVDDTVYCLEAGTSQNVTNERKFEAVEVEISCQVNLSGRAMKEGEYTFELVQVTDESGEKVAENGASATAVNDADGNVVFKGITVDEPGTYYYKIMSEDDFFIAVAEATVDEENKGQLNVSVTYPEGETTFEQVYEASGESRIQGIQIALDNGELKEGEFEFELKDAEGNVLQTASNDADGNVEFEDISYTQDDIGNEYVYTVSMAGDDADAKEATVIVKVEDSQNSNGTLQITQEVAGEGLEFTVERIDKETEEQVTETELVTEKAAEMEPMTETEKVTETELVTETEKAAETEPVTETEKASETEALTETEKASETEALTETEEVSETETVSETEKASETEKESETETKAADKGGGLVLPISISILILLILFIIIIYRRKR